MDAIYTEVAQCFSQDASVTHRYDGIFVPRFVPEHLHNYKISFRASKVPDLAGDLSNF